MWEEMAAYVEASFLTFLLVSVSYAVIMCSEQVISAYSPLQGQTRPKASVWVQVSCQG